MEDYRVADNARKTLRALLWGDVLVLRPTLDPRARVALAVMTFRQYEQVTVHDEDFEGSQPSWANRF